MKIINPVSRPKSSPFEGEVTVTLTLREAYFIKKVIGNISSANAQKVLPTNETAPWRDHPELFSVFDGLKQVFEPFGTNVSPPCRLGDGDDQWLAGRLPR